MEETKSKGSAGNQSVATDNVTNGSGKKLKKSATTDTAKELKREKALRKVLKEELKKKNDRVAELEKELDKQVGKVTELEKEIREKEQKFLDLYLENSTQHDKILELTNVLNSERETYASAMQLSEELSSNSREAKKAKK